MKPVRSFAPRTSRRFLILFAAIFWTLAGIILLTRFFLFTDDTIRYFWFKLSGSIAGGLVFYFILFSGISERHITRILTLENEEPCVFSFFSMKSYFIMALMITSGILLRKSALISPEYLAFFYITMGLPLLFSAVRFYTTFLNFEVHRRAKRS